MSSYVLPIKKPKTPEVVIRAKRTTQNSLFEPQSIDHPVADDLDSASAWLDTHPELLDAIGADLDGGAGSQRGRQELTCETVLRCAVLLHLRQTSYRERIGRINGLFFRIGEYRDIQFVRVEVVWCWRSWL